MNRCPLMQLQSHPTGLRSHAVPRRQQCLCRAYSHHSVRSSSPPPARRVWGSAKAAAAAAALAAALVLPGTAQAADIQQHLCPAPPAAVVEQQQQQSQQSRPGQQRLSSIGELAGLFDSTSEIDPFTLYGTNYKKYQIEKMEGEKVVSRTRGFTVDSCVSAIAASEETPEINGMSTRDKVSVGEGLLCKRAVGPDLKQACKASCTSSCTQALERYEERLFAQSGLRLEPKDRERVLRNCRHSCSYECTKSGTAHDFVVTYRR